MDTANLAAPEIPNFKLAKVGKDRERKRGGFAWFGGGGAGGFSGALGGSGAAGVGGLAGMSLSKALLLMLLAAGLSTGAWQVGKTLSGRAAPSVAAGKKLFSDKDAGRYGDVSGAVKADNAIPNSLGYVAGGLDDRTPEERARAQADEAAARKAEEEAKNKAAAQADGQTSAPGAAALDPEALAKLGGGAEKDKKSLASGRFGQLSAALGGGSGAVLAGGAGLSGGINRNFSAGGGALKGSGGALGSFRAPSRPGATRTASLPSAPSRGKGLARRQLANAFTQSRQAVAAGKAESSAAGASAPFDNNSDGKIGSVISGPGAGVGAAPGAGATPGANPSGGPLNSAPACGGGQYASADGSCQNVGGGGPTHNATPYQNLIYLAYSLIALVLILATIAAFVGKAGPIGQFFAKYLGIIIGMLGASIAGIGLQIMSTDKTIGTLLTAVGGLFIVLAFFADRLVGLAAGGGAPATEAAAPAVLQNMNSQFAGGHLTALAASVG